MAHETLDKPFTFPAEHGFPPFYTLQPNIQTAETQIEMWSRLVLAYCEHYSQFWLNAVGSWERTSALFCNPTIDRALSPAMIRRILAHLVKQNHAIYQPPLPRGMKFSEHSQMQACRETRAQSVKSASQPAFSYEESAGNQVLVLWKTPEEWGDGLYQWVCDTGQNHSIMTLHEIMTGTYVERSQMPPLLLRIALQTQVRKDRAQIFSVTTDRWNPLRAAGDLLAQATDESMLDLGVKFV